VSRALGARGLRARIVAGFAAGTLLVSAVLVAALDALHVGSRRLARSGGRTPALSDHGPDLLSHAAAHGRPGP
jgi:hypothetical protein